MLSADELTLNLGESVKRLRLLQNITQQNVSEWAGVSINALKNLENGTGSSVKTLIRVIRLLNKVDWVLNLAPVISINPLHGAKIKQRARRKKQKVSYAIPSIYFISSERGYIKIGFSKHVYDRLKALQIANGEKLTLLKFYPGTKKQEKALHKRFKKLHLKGEWFMPGLELTNFIESI
jgi:transcriptional regulator with XRE-family HTH domain